MFGVPFSSITFGGALSGATWPAAGASDRVVFLSGADFDAATLSTGATAALSVTNLQTPQPSQKWRSTAINDYIDVTFASPVAANMLALVGHNGSPVASLRVRGFLSSADRTAEANAVIDTNWQSYWPLATKPTLSSWLNFTAHARWSNDTPLTYWRVNLTDGGTGITYLEAGRMMLGRYWQPATNIDLQVKFGRQSADVQVASGWGATYTEARYSARSMTMQFSAASESDAMDGFDELQRIRGMARDLVVIVDPGQTARLHRYSLHGVFAQMSDLTSVPLFGTDGQLWSFSASLREHLF